MYFFKNSKKNQFLKKIKICTFLKIPKIKRILPNGKKKSVSAELPLII